jgi:ankyrin repeat protein
MKRMKNLFNNVSGALSGKRAVNKQDANGETRLLRAVRDGNLTEVKKLLARGADPDIGNVHQIKPLHIAAYWGETNILEALLAAKANPNADNGRGWTPLHSAALAGGFRSRQKNIDMLKAAGARDDIRDINGWTATEYMALWQEGAPAAEKLKQILYSQNIIDDKPVCDSTGKPCPPGCTKKGARAPKH